MANWNLGLLEGLASGVEKGMGAYQTARKSRLDEEKQQRDRMFQDAQAQAQGYERDANGNLVPGKTMLAKQQLEAEYYDPNSVTSQGVRSAYEKIGEGTGIKGLVPENASAAQMEKFKDPANEAIKLMGQQASDRRLAAMLGRQNTQNNRFEETQNQNAVQAGHAFEADPIIKASKNSKNSLMKAVSILDNPDKPLTANDLNLAFNDYINSVTMSNNATEGKIKRELPDTFEQEKNELLQKWGYNTDLRKTKAGKALVDILRKNIDTVNHDMTRITADQARMLDDNYKYHTNQKVRDTVKEKLKAYAPDVYAERYGIDEKPASGKGLIDDGKKQGLMNGQGPLKMVTVQKGKDTVQIPVTDLPDALKDGYQEVK